MKKTLTLSLLGIFLAGLAAAPGYSQTLEEVRKNMIEAQGGAEAVEAIKDLTITGSLDLVQQGLTLAITVYKKEPDKRRMDFEVMGMSGTQCYDGTTAWMINPQTGETTDMPEAAAKSIKRQSLPLVSNLYPEKYGIKHELLDKETVDGKEYIILQETYPDGQVVKNYVDPETWLTTISKAQAPNQLGVEVEVEQHMSDFRDIGGMKIAHSVVAYEDGVESQNITFTEFKINTGLEDELFVRK